MYNNDTKDKNRSMVLLWPVNAENQENPKGSPTFLATAHMRPHLPLSDTRSLRSLLYMYIGFLKFITDLQKQTNNNKKLKSGIHESCLMNIQN